MRSFQNAESGKYKKTHDDGRYKGKFMYEKY